MSANGSRVRESGLKRATLYERVQIRVLPPFLRAARRLPPTLGVGLMIAAGVGQGVIDPTRLRRAFRWMSAHRSGALARGSGVVSLLANRGRFLAWSMGIGNSDLKVFRDSVDLQGRAFLDQAVAAGGAVVASFHLGPGPASDCLTLFGYRPIVGGEGLRFSAPNRPAEWNDLPQPIYVSWADPASRATGLYRLARHVRAGSLVVLPVDAADDGRVEFSIGLPGRTLAVRSGWFTLRRLTGAPTLPVLLHWNGSRRVVRVHPPLPPPDADVERDRLACQSQLTDIVRAYVGAYPEQCLSLALWPDRGDDAR